MTTLKDFNDIIMVLAHTLAIENPDSTIAHNLSYVISIVKQQPQKIIELFIQYVLPFKDKIDTRDEDFFMNHDFGSDDSLVKKVFEFKSIWKKCSYTKKNEIIDYMQCLCSLSLSYFSENYMDK